MSGVLEITRKFTLLGKLRHYLFDCPTFWRRKPAFTCPVCAATYRSGAAERLMSFHGGVEE